MAFSEEIKIEALKSRDVRFGEISIMYTSRLGEIKLNPWRDGFQNLWFLVRSDFHECAGGHDRHPGVEWPLICWRACSIA